MSFMAGEFPIQLIHVWLISYIQFGSRMFTFFSSSGIRVFIIEIKKIDRIIVTHEELSENIVLLPSSCWSLDCL